MKRLFLALVLVLCFSFRSSAWCPTTVTAGTSGGGSACATHNFCDALDEGYIGVGRESADGTYDDSNDGTGVIDYDYDISGLTTGKPASDNNYFRPCDEGMRTDITDSGDGLGEAWVAWDYGSTMTDFTLYMTFYINAFAAGDYIEILDAGASATPRSVGTLDIIIYNNAGTYNIKVEGQTGTDTGYQAIAVQTWHTLKIVHDGDGGDEAGSIYIDGGGAITYDTLTRDTRYWQWGAPAGVSADDDVDWVMGDMHIENDDP